MKVQVQWATKWLFLNWRAKFTLLKLEPKWSFYVFRPRNKFTLDPKYGRLHYMAVLWIKHISNLRLMGQRSVTRYWILGKFLRKKRDIGRVKKSIFTVTSYVDDPLTTVYLPGTDLSRRKLKLPYFGSKV